jgi:phosphoserine phosphatase RsbU/P
MNTAPGGELVSKLRHDLRTPINHILGYTELVGEEVADGGTNIGADLEKIRQAARRMLEIVDHGTSSAETPADPAPAGTPVILPNRDKPPARASASGRILVVDDDASNRETLVRRLIKDGHVVDEASHGREAIERLVAQPCDLVLLDVMMPVMDGFSALEAIRSHADLAYLPVIMISALDELEAVTRCIEAGAEDYLPKPCEPALLRARIGACLEKKRLRDREREYLRTIEETQASLLGELREAARYVESILPPEIDAPLRARWSFAPSNALGGDVFGFHNLSSERLAIYLLDVCGHGVGAALLSVAAASTLRSRSLPGIDFSSPREVLGGLNTAFPMEANNEMYFSIWYGVYDFSSRVLRHASGGHPPALLVTSGQPLTEISSQGMLVGILPGGEFPEAECAIPPDSRLVIYSDGAYELQPPEGRMLGLDDFKDWVSGHATDPDLAGSTLRRAREITNRSVLEDDLSVLCLDFSG